MSTTLCAIEPCYIRGRHADDGCDADCTGCLPGLALDGLRICRHHYSTSRRDLRRLPALDNELTKCLVRDSNASNGGNVTGSTTPGLDLNPTVFEFRDHLRERLAAIIGYVAEERGFAGPKKWDVTNVCAWIDRSHDWIAASRLAPTYVKQINALAKRAHNLAYPSGTRVIDVGPCTEHTTSDEGERVPCTGTLKALIRDESALLPSQIVCDGPEPHTFAPREWMGLGRRIHGSSGLNRDGATRLAKEIAG